MISPLKKMYYDILADYRKINFLMHKNEYTVGEVEKLYSSFFQTANSSIDYIASYHPEYALEKIITNSSEINIIKKYRQTITVSEKKIPAMEYSRDIDNVFQHSKISRYDAKINNVEQLKESTLGIIYKDENGYYGSFVIILLAKLSENEFILCNVLTYAVMNAIRALFLEIGVISKNKGNFEPPNFYISRKSSRTKGLPRINIMEGLPAGTEITSLGDILVFDKNSDFGVRVRNENENINFSMDMKVNIIREP